MAIEIYEFLWLVIGVIVVVGGITQVIIPISKGTPMFPILISKHQKLSEELSKAKEEVENSELEEEIEETRKKIKHKEVPKEEIHDHE